LSPLQTEDKTKSLGEVKRRSREALLNSNDPIVTLKMIDSIQGLGIGHHLEDEINIQLGRICDWDPSQDLNATSLQFRLLRHNGWPTCSGILHYYFGSTSCICFEFSYTLVHFVMPREK